MQLIIKSSYTLMTSNSCINLVIAWLEQLYFLHPANKQILSFWKHRILWLRVKKLEGCLYLNYRNFHRQLKCNHLAIKKDFTVFMMVSTKAKTLFKLYTFQKDNILLCHLLIPISVYIWLRKNSFKLCKINQEHSYSSWTYYFKVLRSVNLGPS